MSKDILDALDNLDIILDDSRYKKIEGETKQERRKRLRREWYRLNPDTRKRRYASHKKWKHSSEENIESARESLRKHKYKMPKGKYKEMLEKQSGKCKICNKSSKLYVDHNHTTGNIRGLLCQSCNVRLAGIENKIYFDKAIQYLKEYGDI